MRNRPGFSDDRGRSDNRNLVGDDIWCRFEHPGHDYGDAQLDQQDLHVDGLAGLRLHAHALPVLSEGWNDAYGEHSPQRSIRALRHGRHARQCRHVACDGAGDGNHPAQYVEHELLDHDLCGWDDFHGHHLGDCDEDGDGDVDVDSVGPLK